MADDDLENFLNWPHPFFGCQSMLKFGKLKVEDSLTINDSIPKKHKSMVFKVPFMKASFNCLDYFFRDLEFPSQKTKLKNRVTHYNVIKPS